MTWQVATNVRNMTPSEIEEEIEKILADWKTRLSVTDVVDYIKDAAQVLFWRYTVTVTVTRSRSRSGIFIFATHP